MVHGPGCPVCVTPLELIDKAIALASREDVIFASFGDMLRVPGSSQGPLFGQGAGRGYPDRLFAAGRPEDRQREPRQGDCLFCRRVRNDGASQRDGRISGQGAGHKEFSPCWCPMSSSPRRWRPSCRRPPTACKGSSRPATSARLWVHGIRAHRPEIPGSHRRDGVRTGRYPAGCLYVR